MTKLTKLPANILNELQEQIRENHYSNLYVICEWLKKKGYLISKTALHRYVASLKQIDGYTARSGSFELLALTSTNTTDSSNLSKLYQQLGKLEYQKQKILQKITSIQEPKPYQIKTK
ncbi:phage protein Gp27 family protein [Glaesserella parasuis]|uniref:Bacteriophage Mu GP27-like protein n=1 Tax=Glaesserella parasuis serovar 5 (strain SH0165) TaxID=557723 RepID=B8F3N4_GLAP5|nr:phage protein Gp27 family protein [Glaesserella parasuis]ACL31936.1 bacteriophage Mu GP27-like protein [Glaesserella parasuis SH0165]EMY46077.1 GP27-like protein [Glaesserella parasuis gx033]MDG6247765.1 DUF3486 family protein [Glaesserella parasuis]MDG6283261.1 DUF3486 family protein [Glaesserella parasuis]MDG6324201.1 DUF3486 family protein [Glaesserella parasuis]